MEVAVMGIDPGITGGMALIGTLRDGVCDLPVQTMVNSSRKEIVIDACELGRKLHEVKRQFTGSGRELVVYVERTQPMKDSAMTAFSMGQSRGIILAVLSVLKVPFVQVLPQKWKKFHGLVGCDKDASRTLAIQLYPDMADFLKRKKDHNRAEALLIATYGSKMENR